MLNPNIYLRLSYRKNIIKTSSTLHFHMNVQFEVSPYLVTLESDSDAYNICFSSLLITYIILNNKNRTKNARVILLNRRHVLYCSVI